MTGLTLSQLIETLEAMPRDMPVRMGFGEPMSYRGYYEDLAFEPIQNTTVGAMLDHARSALNAEFEGYKGGAYRMDATTDVWVAAYGCVGRRILGWGPVLDSASAW